MYMYVLPYTVYAKSHEIYRPLNMWVSPAYEISDMTLQYKNN